METSIPKVASAMRMARPHRIRGRGCNGFSGAKMGPGAPPSCRTATMPRASQGGRGFPRGVSALECRATCRRVSAAPMFATTGGTCAHRSFDFGAADCAVLIGVKPHRNGCSSVLDSLDLSGARFCDGRKNAHHLGHGRYAKGRRSPTVKGWEPLGSAHRSTKRPHHPRFGNRSGPGIGFRRSRSREWH